MVLALCKKYVFWVDISGSFSTAGRELLEVVASLTLSKLSIQGVGVPLFPGGGRCEWIVPVLTSLGVIVTSTTHPN